MRAFKAVTFHYQPTGRILEILADFRDMVNSAINICLQENILGRFNLRKRVYREFRQKYGVASDYPYWAAQVAWSIVKKYRRWQRKPVARRLMLKMGSPGCTLNHAILSLPFK